MVRASGCDPLKTPDIARQLIENPEAKNLRVIFGCGRREFRNQTTVDETGEAGLRSDGRDLIAEWQLAHNKNGTYVWNREQLDAIVAAGVSNNATANATAGHVLGLFGSAHCAFQSEIESDPQLAAVVPTLSEMTLSAIRLLDREPNGYFLFVESARIDHAHHLTQTRRVMEEMEEFVRTIEAVRKATNGSETLLVVTSDHSHVMSYNGYSVSDELAIKMFK